MHTPISTYRLQANCNFTLHDIQGIIDYLDQLGISTLYCAPFFQSRSGSNHGYDVINPSLINPELGTIDDLRQIASVLKTRNMNWLQDIVPNHMSYNHNNSWIRDIFEKGIHSAYRNSFDIDWNYSHQKIKGKVLLPFLGEELNALVDQKKINVSFSREGLVVNFYDVNYPLLWSSYYTVLSQGNDADPIRDDSFRRYMEILDQLKDIRDHYEDASKASGIVKLKEELFFLYSSDKAIQTAIDHSLQLVNKEKEVLMHVLDQQCFFLVHYTQTDKEINYRRFFVINDLICLRIESPEVFDTYHSFLKTLMEEDIIQGLRVDHIDGLADPGRYLEELRDLAGENCYIIVEKILEEKEKLPSSWPMEGTSGYEFLSCMNHLFTKSENKQAFTEIYHQFIGYAPNYEKLVFEKKTYILLNKMNGELDNLITLFLNIAPAQYPLKDHLKDALAIFMASFNVYRTYVNKLPIENDDRRVIEDAFEKAEQHKPELFAQFQFLRSVLLVDPEDADAQEKLELLIRLQQFTGPLAAKGVEDTVFYVYNRLISHNEVGDSPDRFGMSVPEFHEAMQWRLQHLPLSINATATHDTKRGEDARMRINSLSEMPHVWSEAVSQWKKINRRYKQTNEQGEAPSENDEYFIYQSLLGGLPADDNIDEMFVQRFKEFMIKALRESRVNTDWDHPNEHYEKVIVSFIELIIKDQEFINAFMPLFQVVKRNGMILSLAQTLLRVTAPGIPDTYQGSELWDLNFVDPDNRRMIDYTLRKKILSESMEEFQKDSTMYLKQLMTDPSKGQIKLYTLWRSLNTRKLKPTLFHSGSYIPLTFVGAHSHRLVGFARHWEDQWSITIAPKEVKALDCGKDFPVGEIWKDTIVILPAAAPDQWRNVFTNESLRANHYTLQDKPSKESDAPIDAAFSSEMIIGKRLTLQDICKQFPIALLENVN